MKSGDLALLGGEPVRGKPYPPHNTIIDSAEKEEVLEVLASGLLSGFSGRAGDRFLGGEKVKKLESLPSIDIAPIIDYEYKLGSDENSLTNFEDIPADKKPPRKKRRKKRR